MYAAYPMTANSDEVKRMINTGEIKTVNDKFCVWLNYDVKNDYNLMIYCVRSTKTTLSRESVHTDVRRGNK